jgi:CubicO group peptidase (beta-lactamase class C family)
LGWIAKATGLGSGCSPRTFGHNGSTGTLCWAGPAKGMTFVLLTTLPAADDKDHIAKAVSDSISES